MKVFEALLGIGSIVTTSGVVLGYMAGPFFYESLGRGVLAIPIIGVITTFASLFYVYHGSHLGWRGASWVLLMGLFWFILLPVFWYRKVYNSKGLDT